MSHPMRYAGGVFHHHHEEMVGVEIDFDAFDPGRFPDELRKRARQTWYQRAQTEFRSTQIMTRFMTEVMGAGDPIDVYAVVVDLIEDEARHTALCAAMCRALGGTPRFPDPIVPDDPREFLDAPMGERAMTTAISMVAISEALSYGFMTDLRERCEEPTVEAVLAATVDDEEDHQELGWAYVGQSLKRFPASTRRAWCHLVKTVLGPHLVKSAQVLEDVPEKDHHLQAFPEPDLVELGLLSEQRQALLVYQTVDEVVEPRLRSLELWPEELDELLLASSEIAI